MFYLASNGYIEAVKILLNNGAEINYKNKNGYSVYDAAKKCENGYCIYDAAKTDELREILSDKIIK